MNLTVDSTVKPPASESSSCHSLKEHAHESAWLSEETCEANVPSDCPVSTPTQRRTVERKRLTVSLPLDLLERSRNTVYWTKGLTLAKLLEQALVRSLDQWEELNGQPFPRRLEDLKGGRPRNSDR